MIKVFVPQIFASRQSDSFCSVNMDAPAIFHNLLDHNAAKRVEVLIIMRKLIRNNNSHMPFRNMSKEAVFEILAYVLDDVRWEVRYQCLLLIAAIIQNSEDEVDSYMLLVMPKVICNLGHENTNIRRAALQVLHMHMKYTSNLQRFLKMFIQYGLESEEYVTRKGCITSVGILFTSEFANENLSPLIECLSRHIVHDDASLFYLIFLAMQKINELVGTVTFDLYLQRLDKEAVNTYKRVLNKFYFNDSCLSSSSGSHVSFPGNLNESSYGCDSKIAKYEFGIFESYIIENIRSTDWKVRIENIEHMKMILRDTPDLVEQILDVDKFLIFLSTLLNDTNFKIVILTLSIYDLLIDKFRKEIKRFLRTFISAVSKHLGDAKLVVREHAIKVVHKLMHHVKPSDVLSNLLENKNHRNPRLREEIINRVTAAVLTFPSYSIEFSVLCEAIAPLLVDAKRRVRLAALECFAVLAQAMGPTRLIPLVAAVDGIELNFDGEGLMTAVQARLARRILPKCTEDGSVTYAVTIPSSAGNSTRVALSYGADIDWIMAASGSSSSSTPPSRSKDSAWRESSAAVGKPKVVKSKSDDLICLSKTDDEIFSTSEDDSNFPVLHKNIRDSATIRRKSSYDDKIVKPAMLSSVKGSDVFDENLPLNKAKQNNDNFKIRTGIPGSRIPILASRNSVRKSITSEEAHFNSRPSIDRLPSPCRLRNPSPPPPLLPRQFLNSASQKNVSNNHSYDGDVFKLGVLENGNGIVLRKISPSGSALRGKPILVRSPSLSQLQHLPQWNYETPNEVYNTTPSAKVMGNIGSYFRSSPSGVIVAQPAPIHLDNVNDINVIVLDDPIKVPSSPSPHSWTSAEFFHPPRSGSCKNSGRRSPDTNSMPDVCSVRRNSHYSAPASINEDSYTSPLNGMDSSSISISKITREKMLKRQQEILREAEERRIARERSQQEHKQLLEKRLLEERERQLRQQQHSSSTEDETTEDQSEDIESAVTTQCTPDSVVRPNSKPSTPPAKMTPSPPPISPSTTPVTKTRVGTTESKNGSAKALSRSSSLKTSSASKRLPQLNQSSTQNLSQMSKRNLAASSLALFDDSQNGVSAFPNPDSALKKALKSLSTETWMGKIEGIQTISRLAQMNPDVLLPHLHPVVLALLAEVKNLRSSVSRSAILAMGELFSALKRNMEQDLDLIASTLLSKSGETVGFIRDDIEKVMKLLIEAVTPNKAALSVISGGASHRNGAVRKTAAHSLVDIVEKMGAARILTTAKDVTEKLLPVTAQFLMDGMPLTRYYGRRIFEMLMTHPSFDKLLLKYVQPSTLRNISSILDTVRKRGAGDMPKEKLSARTHKIDIRRSVVLNRTM